MRRNGHGSELSRSVIVDLARMSIGLRMSARLLGCSVAWVAQVRKEAGIPVDAETAADLIARLPDDLRRRIADYRAGRAPDRRSVDSEAR